MNESGSRKGVIGLGTAFVLYLVLALWSIATLKGIALAFALIVIGGLAAKTYIHFLRSRIE